MELDHRSCVLPSNAPALPDPSSAVAADTPSSSTHSRGILQERSANRRHDYATNNLPTSTSTANPATSTWKQSRSSSPTENIYSGNGQGQPTLTGNYFTGNVGSHHIGLTGLGGDKTEVQIERETERLWRLVHRCEKYQKYRERQPTSQKDKEQKWPNDLERAFFRALVRWPPMGRRKHMLEGQLRGRNELVAASIYKDTGIPRTRKQVSSHIQVLKNLVSEQPAVLVYMATEDIGGKRHRGHHSSHAHHLAHLRSRHPSSKYDFNAPTSHVWSNYHGLPSAPTLHKMQHGDSSPYTVADFAMFVQFKGHIEHDFTRLSADGRLSDLHITDIASWHQRYQELKFLPTDEWKEKGRRVLLCDASVKVMTEKPPLDADIIILFNLHSRHDLTVYERLQCTTRFYDNGNLAEQRESAGGKFWNVKETRTPCEYWPDHEAHAAGAGPSPGRLNVSFGSKFWATRMYDFSKQLQRAASAEEPSQRVKYESEVRRNLQYLTATQDIYGIKRGTGESQCLLTILWRFNQTKSSSEVGKMNWRVVNFSPHQSSSQKWMKEEEEMGLGLETDEMKVAKGLALDRATSTGAEPSLYPSTIPLDFHHHPSHPYAQHPPSLDLDTLSSMQLDAAEFSHPNSATAPSMVTDYSQQSVPSLSHSQDTIAVTQSQEYPQDNEFDFNGGHITISGCLQPSMNMGGYDSYGSQAANMHNLNSLAGLEHDQSHDSFADLGLSAVVGGVTLSNCYSTKPAWHHSNLISTLEGAAEQYHTLLDQSQAGHGHDSFHPHHQGTHSEDIAGHGVLHDGQLNAGLWKLQSAFGEDTGVGAVADHRKDSHVGVVGGVGVGVGVGGNGVGVNAGNGQGMGILEMIERDQRVRGGY